jgi:hypothetical protein
VANHTSYGRNSLELLIKKMGSGLFREPRGDRKALPAMHATVLIIACVPLFFVHPSGMPSEFDL